MLTGLVVRATPFYGFLPCALVQLGRFTNSFTYYCSGPCLSRSMNGRGFQRLRLRCLERMFSHSLPSLTPSPLPAPLETHLWYVKPCEVNSESLIKQYFNILSPCEREKVLEMRGEDLRKCALLSRVLVRTTIARYQPRSEINPRTLKFQKNIHGKPELDWGLSNDWQPPPLHFNISHSSSLVACGVTINSQIGIDVEDKHRSIRQDIVSFARRYFTKKEIQFLTAISDPRVQRMEFIKLWTLKEAYVKALGKGFSGAPFKTFTISYKGLTGRGFHTLEDVSDKDSEIVVESIGDLTDFTSDWQFLLLELANSHYAAICTEKLGASECNGSIPVKLKVWRTIPYLEDEYVSGTDAVKMISGIR